MESHELRRRRTHGCFEEGGKSLRCRFTPLVIEIESEGITSLIEKVKQAESQSDTFRSELIAQIKEEMSAEEAKSAENEMESENLLKSMKSYAIPAAFIASIGVGLGILTKWK